MTPLFRPPEPLPPPLGLLNVFLAGRIEMGRAEQWQVQRGQALESAHLREQVEWERAAA